MTTRFSTMIKWLFTLSLLCLTMGVYAESESRGSRDASGLREALVDQSTSENTARITWSEMEQALDRASASWMQVYGEAPFLAVKEHSLMGWNAMQALKWVPDNTYMVFTMFDARGDHAEAKNGQCRVQININEKGNSPVIQALGGFKSSVAFLTAHELAHCRFDSLSDTQRFPTAQMYRALGVPSSLTPMLMRMLVKPTNKEGSDHFRDAYDEALADAAAAIALRVDEDREEGRRYGGALERAQAIRFGTLSMANRRKTAAEDHQGAFVFQDVALLPTEQLTWDSARYIALHSVLRSSLYVPVLPRWFEASNFKSKKQRKEAQAMVAVFKQQAIEIVSQRESEKDEDIYLSSNSVSLFAFTMPDQGGAFNDTPPEALARWQKVATIK